MSEVKYVGRELHLINMGRGTWEVLVYGWPDTVFREPRVIQTVHMSKDKDAARRAFERHAAQNPNLKTFDR